MHKTHSIINKTANPNDSADERTGKWLLIAGGVLLGTIGIFVEEANQHPLLTVWFRCLFGAVALLLLGLMTGQLNTLLLDRRGLRIAVVSGVLMISNWALFFAAIAKTSIAVATIVFHIQPFWVLLFGLIVLREAVSLTKSLATMIALLGLVLSTGLLNDISDLQTIDSDYLVGLLMCLGGSLSYAAVTVIAKTEKRVTSFALAWWQCAVGTLVLSWTPHVFHWPDQPSAWVWLAGLGVIHTGLAYAILFSGMARLSLGNVALLQFVYPLTAIVIDWLVYDRVLQAVQLLGVSLMAITLWAIRSPGAKTVGR